MAFSAFSSVTAHDTALPADNDALLYGDAVEASVAASVMDGDVRYDCIGWTGSGSAPLAAGGRDMIQWRQRGRETCLPENWIFC